MFAKNYSQYYDLFHKDKPYKQETKFVYEWAMKPKSILDIGCGTAIYWKYFPRATEIMGIEKSKQMINGHAKDGKIICADVSELPLGFEKFDSAMALFNVINYIPINDWWKKIPIKKGGYFIFDIWNKSKVMRDGFKTTTKVIGDVFRRITPDRWDNNSVDLKIEFGNQKDYSVEFHRMFLHSHKDILGFCGKHFELVCVKQTDSWQTWYKCRRK